jgi:hypothetical protein
MKALIYLDRARRAAGWDECYYIVSGIGINQVSTSSQAGWIPVHVFKIIESCFKDKNKALLYCKYEDPSEKDIDWKTDMFYTELVRKVCGKILDNKISWNGKVIRKKLLPDMGPKLLTFMNLNNIPIPTFKEPY